MNAKESERDWSKYLDSTEKTRKQRLIESCQANDVSIYIDDPNEESSSIFRSVASEAVLEERLNSKLALDNSYKALKSSNTANIISLIACGIASISLIISIFN